LTSKSNALESIVANKRPVRLGILGAARIVPNALIKPAEQLGTAEVVAIAARDPIRARAFAADNGIPQVLPSYDELIAASNIDAIYIPLPNSLHCEWTIRALRAGKHVLCEKPIASNATEAQQMEDVASETRLVLAEAFHYRYHPLAARVRELLRAGCIGRVVHFDGHFSAPSLPTDIRYNWDLSGGATMDLGCYLLDMLCYFSGFIPVVRRAKARLGPPKIDVAMEAELEFAHGVNAHISCSIAGDTQAGAWFAARGECGELLVTNPVAPHRGHLLTIRSSAGEQWHIVEGDATYVYQLKAFVAAVRDNERIATGGSDGVLNMRLIDDVYCAAGLPRRGSLSPAPNVGLMEEAALKSRLSRHNLD
jgi:predicted dehydrogenase